MINERSLEAVQKASFEKEFVKPLYDSYCFSRIPGTILTLFGGEGERLPLDVVEDNEYDAIILLLIDGFGWRFFKKYEERFPFLKRFREEGRVSKITSQFPSTTAAHVTCINTGLTPSQSGVYEWFYYEPKVDRIIAPLLFSFAGDKQVNTLESTGIRPEELYPTHTLYQRLQQLDVASFVFQERSIAHSPYSKVMLRGAKVIPFEELTDALISLTSHLDQRKGKKSYFYLYFGDIDSYGHRVGIESAEFVEAIESCFDTFEELLGKNLPPRTLCLLTADHGMVSVNPATTHYLNKELPDLQKHFKKNKKGAPLVPAGSCRDFFLHVQEEAILEVASLLKHHFKSIASIIPTQELIAQGFFGSTFPSPVFLNRVGNLVILPYHQHSIWWYEKNHFDQHFHGAHGGLTRDEMEIPLLSLG